MTTDAAHWVAEYNARRRLAVLGYTSPIADLDDYTARIFLEIDATVDKEESRLMKERTRHGRK